MALYDPLENASPVTRERFLNTLARRKGREASFQVKISPSHPEVQAHLENQAWVHWEYSPQDWARFEQVDWKRPRLTFWAVTGGLAASVLAAILPWFLFSLQTDAGLISSLFGPAMGGASLLVFPWVVALSFYDEARKRHQARQQPARTVTFTRQGVWEAGTFFPLEKELKSSIKKVTLTGSPPVVHFLVERWSWGQNRPHRTLNTLHVPVPRGHEDEAAHLVHRFLTEVIEARKPANQPGMNPPEPV